MVDVVVVHFSVLSWHRDESDHIRLVQVKTDERRDKMVKMASPIVAGSDTVPEGLSDYSKLFF